MIDILLILWLIISLAPLAPPEQAPPPPPAAKPVTFKTDVQPILERRCTPCHFPGGVMHETLPFDRGETVVELGTKLFTRIKKDDEQAVIRAYLASATPAAAAPAAAQPAPAARPRAKAKTSNAARAHRE